MRFIKSKWIKAILLILIIPTLLFSILIGYVYLQQDKIVQKLVTTFNKSMTGEIKIRKSHIAPFKNFPFISIALNDVILYEDKSKTEEKEIVHLEDLYIGFDVLAIVSGNYQIKVIKLDKGHIDVIQNEEGELNIVEAFQLSDDEDKDSETINLSLDKIDLDNVHVSFSQPHKQDKIEVDFKHIHSKYKLLSGQMLIDLDTDFKGSLTKNGHQTLLNDKHFAIKTQLQYLTDKQKIILSPSRFTLEHIFLNIAGMVELDGEKNIDLKIDGSQENFNLLIAFAPKELIPTLKSYENKGKIYVKSTVKGSLKDGQPSINAEFGCEEGFFENQNNKKKLDNIEFHGAFTNGEKRDFSTMKFTMNKMKAQPEAGIFDANLIVEDFNSPKIDLNLKSNFNLDFLVKFLNLDKEIKNAKGYVGITMNFHDIIDLTQPEKSLEKLNESYFTELIVKNLSFDSKSLSLPVKNINMHADMEGNKLKLEHLNGQYGNSDINISGSVSDVPAIIHQRNIPIQTNLKVESKHIDFTELTFDNKLKKASFDEKADNFNLDLAFHCEASALSSFKKIPIGEFILKNLNVKLQKYPHEINEVTAGLYIEENDIKIRRFKGKLDDSDFLFFGKLNNYQQFLNPSPKAKSAAEIFFKSNQIKLENILSYNGENMLPDNIKNETFTDVKLKAKISARFDGDKIKGAMLDVSKLDLTTSLHEKRIQDISGKMIFRKNNFKLKNLKGNIGQSDFDISFNYFLGENDSLKKKNNELILISNHFDLNEILAIKYTAPKPTVEGDKKEKVVQEAKPFSIMNFPFMDFYLETDLKHFEYLDYRFERVKGKISVSKDKQIDLKRCGFDLAGGKVRLSGKLDARDATNITFRPRINIKNLILDQALMRFQNFGQEYILSENLSGTLNTKIRGTIPLNEDLTPKMEGVDLTVDVQIIDGEIKKYKQLEEFASFFGDKNMKRVAFDTLQNSFIIKNNRIVIPWMTINSSLGFLEVAGEQDLTDKMDMEYYLKIPLKLVSNVAYQKLFKRKREEIDPDQEDEIQYRGDKKVHYINIKMLGDLSNFSISLGKDKRDRKKSA